MNTSTDPKKVTAIQKAKIDFKGQPSLGAVLALMKLAAQEAREEGYEAARKDLNAIHGAKWAKEDYASGVEAMRERAAKHLRSKADHVRGDYNGTDLLDKMAMDIRALPLTEAGKEPK